MRSSITISEKSTRPAVLLRSLCIAGLAIGLASAAQARIETLRWTHAAPPWATGFRVHVGSASHAYTQNIDVGLPAADSAGIYSYDLQVADGETVYVAVSAYNSAGEGPLSNERMRQPASPPVNPPVTPPADSQPTTTTTTLPTTTTTLPVDSGDDDVVFSGDFDTSATGQYVPGWVDTQAWNSMSEDDSLFSVTTLSGNRVFTTSSTQTDIHSHYVGGGSADWFLYEVKGRMRVSSTAARLGVTAHSKYTSEDVYYRLGSAWQTGEMELLRHPYPDDTFLCESRGTGVIPEANAWYEFRFQVIPEAGGTRLQAKFWKASDEQPTQWQAGCTDVSPNRPSSGTIGVWSGSTGAKYWDRLRVIALPGGMVPGGASEPLGRPGTPKLISPGL